MAMMTDGNTECLWSSRSRISGRRNPFVVPYSDSHPQKKKNSSLSSVSVEHSQSVVEIEKKRQLFQGDNLHAILRGKILAQSNQDIIAKGYLEEENEWGRKILRFLDGAEQKVPF